MKLIFSSHDPKKTDCCGYVEAVDEVDGTLTEKENYCFGGDAIDLSYRGVLEAFHVVESCKKCHSFSGKHFDCATRNTANWSKLTLILDTVDFSLFCIHCNLCRWIGEFIAYLHVISFAYLDHKMLLDDCAILFLVSSDSFTCRKQYPCVFN